MEVRQVPVFVPGSQSAVRASHAEQEATWAKEDGRFCSKRKKMIDTVADRYITGFVPDE